MVGVLPQPQACTWGPTQLSRRAESGFRKDCRRVRGRRPEPHDNIEARCHRIRTRLIRQLALRWSENLKCHLERGRQPGVVCGKSGP